MKDPNSFIDQLKTQLETLDKTTAKPNWESVLITLNKNRRRRYATWIISSLGTLTVLLLFLNQCETGSADSLATPIQQESQKSRTIVTTNKDELNITPTNVEPDSVTNQTLSGTDSLALENNKQTPKREANTGVSLNNSTLQNVRTGTLDSADFIQGSQVKTTYYYYNDLDNTQIVTQNKAQIDSLILNEGRTVSKDSIQE